MTAMTATRSAACIDDMADELILGIVGWGLHNLFYDTPIPPGTTDQKRILRIREKAGRRYLCRLRRVCTGWRRIVSDRFLWGPLRANANTMGRYRLPTVDLTRWFTGTLLVTVEADADMQVLVGRLTGHRVQMKLESGHALASAIRGTLCCAERGVHVECTVRRRAIDPHTQLVERLPSGSSAFWDDDTWRLDRPHLGLANLSLVGLPGLLFPHMDWANFPNLTALTLMSGQWNGLITAPSLHAIIQALPGLKTACLDAPYSRAGSPSSLDTGSIQTLILHLRPEAGPAAVSGQQLKTLTLNYLAPNDPVWTGGRCDLSKCPRLRDLRVRNGNLSPHPEIFPMGRGLTQLVAESCWLPDPGVLCSLPALRSLVLTDCMHDVSVTIAAVGTACPELQELRIDCRQTATDIGLNQPLSLAPLASSRVPDRHIVLISAGLVAPEHFAAFQAAHPSMQLEIEQGAAAESEE